MKSDFYIDRVSKDEIKDLLYTHHYLKDESKDFKSGYNYGLFKHPDWECPLRLGGCLGACVFTGLPVPAPPAAPPSACAPVRPRN